MRIRLRISMNRLLAATASMTIGLTGILAFTTAPALAATAPAYGNYSCWQPLTRFFQLRDGDANSGYSELWVAGVTNPESSATVYSWKKAATLSINATSIAARGTAIVSGVPVTFVYFTGVDGNLYEGQWRSSPSEEWSATQLTSSGVHTYTNLAYEDDGHLWGVKDGDLYRMYAPQNMTTPTNWTKHKSGFGNPYSFFAVPGDQFALGYTDSSGALRYMKPSGSVTTLRTSGYNSRLIAGLGDGLTYRFNSSASSLTRFTIGSINSTGTLIKSSDTVATSVTTPLSTQITAVSNQCELDFAHPIPDGTNKHNYLATGPNWTNGVHRGLDLSAPCGTPVYAAHPGIVVDPAGNSWGGPNLIKVSQGSNSLTSWYAHMQSLDVAPGDHVIAGQRLGTVGDLGNATGCHLHFEVHSTNTDSEPSDQIDPDAWLSAHGLQ